SATPMAPRRRPSGKKSGTVPRTRAAIVLNSPRQIRTLLVFPPKIDRPCAAGMAGSRGLKTFAAQFFDQRRWQERGNDREAFLRFQGVDLRPNNAERFR